MTNETPFDWTCPNCQTINHDSVGNDGPFFTLICNDCDKTYHVDDEGLNPAEINAWQEKAEPYELENLHQD